MTRGKIVTLSTAAIYLFLILFIFFQDPVSPIGPCGPSTGMMVFLALPVVAGMGLIISGIFLAAGHRSGKSPALINGMVMVAFFGLLLSLGWLH